MKNLNTLLKSTLKLTLFTSLLFGTMKSQAAATYLCTSDETALSEFINDHVAKAIITLTKTNRNTVTVEEVKTFNPVKPLFDLVFSASTSTNSPVFELTKTPSESGTAPFNGTIYVATSENEVAVEVKAKFVFTNDKPKIGTLLIGSRLYNFKGKNCINNQPSRKPGKI